MHYFKNIDVAETYKISNPTVGKWIKASLNGKNNLQLTNVSGRHFILNNEQNKQELYFLSNKGEKFKNKIGYEKIRVSSSLSEIFSKTQYVELITSLKSAKQIPLKFSYLDSGSEIWAKYVDADISSDHSYISEGARLIKSSMDYLIFRLKDYKIINIVDIFPGNGYLSRVILERLIKAGFKVKYNAIDISQKMLEILAKNMQEWCPEAAIKTEVGDIDYIFLRDKLFFNRIHSDESNCNLVLLLNSIIGNTSDRSRVFKNMHDILPAKDLMWVHNGLKYKGELAELDSMTRNTLVLSKCLWIPKALGFEDSTYQVHSKYSEVMQSRVIVMKLNKDVDLVFNIENKEEVIAFDRDDEIIVWNYHSYTLRDFIAELNEADFETVHVSTYPDNSEALILCEIAE